MTAPFPIEATAGTKVDPAEAEALNLYRHYAWMARLSDEMHIDAELDLKRTMQLVMHIREYRRWHDALSARSQAQTIGIVEGIFAQKKCRWASQAEMGEDLAALHAAAGTVADWIEANAPEYKEGYSVNKEVAPGVITDEPIKVPKPQALGMKIAELRAQFGVKG